MSQSILWVGHSGKLRKRRRVNQRNNKREPATSNPEGSGSHTHDVGVDKPSTSNDVPKTTRNGHQEKTPARFSHSTGPFTKRGKL